jgi:regulator of PEP synthase PpsR (kinase-PPPase family)
MRSTLNVLSADSRNREVNQLSDHLAETVVQRDLIDEDPSRYVRSDERTIEQAVFFVMDADDGRSIRHYDRADVILTGVSRSGKTPTCIYLALQYGVFAANYPLTEEYLESGRLPDTLLPYREKLYGLTIAPQRLRQIRLERRPVGRYASAQQVSFELRSVEALYKKIGISFIDTTHFSTEEIASTIVSELSLERRLGSKRRSKTLSAVLHQQIARRSTATPTYRSSN